MGREARANLRSTEGGKPAPFVSLHRLWRAVAQFHDDRPGFERWMDSRDLSLPHRATLEKLWSEQHRA